jgi:hypothetical protein
MTEPFETFGEGGAESSQADHQDGAARASMSPGAGDRSGGPARVRAAAGRAGAGGQLVARVSLAAWAVLRPAESYGDRGEDGAEADGMTNHVQGERQRITRTLIRGAAVLDRLLGRNRPNWPTGPQLHRPNPDAVVDCALYLNGRRVPGQPHYADAYAATRHRRDAFVWLGLPDPTRQ